MRLQNLLVIFVIIALPVIIVLSIFVNYQIDTARLKASYASKLIDATYDTVAAFQLNTNNNTYSSVADSLMEDIEASSNIFVKSLASNLGVAGASESQIMTYVPALLYTLYDGYYIYTPVRQSDGTFVHDIKPYVYYTKTYTNGSKTLTINFSLDNYVAVYYDNGSWYESRAGYLESQTDDTRADGTSYKGCNITDADAINYYKEAYAFTKWFNDTVLRDFGTTTEAYSKLYINENNSPLQGTSSSFNDEKIDVIEKSINNNLFQAMNIYGKNVGMDFRAPILNGEDWDKIFNNICVISFMQGIPVGTSIFNDYAIITSTDNSMYVDENTLYFTGSEDGDQKYHRIGCTELKGTITGHNRAEFKIKQLEEDGEIKYTYPNPASACYFCMVRASSASLPTSQEEASWYSNLSERKKRETAYYTALGKQKYKLVKISDYINVNEGNNIEQNIANDKVEK